MDAHHPVWSRRTLVAGLAGGLLSSPGAGRAQSAPRIHMNDPVDHGLASSLARPGGNVTGVASQSGNALGGKRVELLKDIVPGLRRVAMLIVVPNQVSAETMDVTRRAADAMNIARRFKIRHERSQIGKIGQRPAMHVSRHVTFLSWGRCQGTSHGKARRSLRWDKRAGLRPS